MSIFNNIFNSYQVFINTLKYNVFRVKNELLNDNNTDTQNFIAYSQAAEPCRSCTDFRTFSRLRRQEFSQTQVIVLLFKEITRIN